MFAVICCNHLGIVDQLMHLTECHKKQKADEPGGYPLDEEANAEKETKGKEKAEEDEKICHHYNNFQVLSSFFNAATFIAYNTLINQPPYCEAEVHPPDSLFV